MRMIWDEIVSKYPNQYVGLMDTEIDASGELIAADVIFEYKFVPDIMRMHCTELCSIFWTGDLISCPALTLPSVRKSTVSRRMTWPEIVNKYPMQPVGLINTLWLEKKYPTNVRSAIVIVEDAEWGNLQADSMRGYLDIVPTGDLWSPFNGLISVSI